MYPYSNTISPYAAGPQMAPYGAFGDFLDQHGRQLGRAIGSNWGQGGLGGDIGDFAGNLAGRYLPFSAGPGMAPQPELAPYGAFGNFFGAVAPGAGRMIGRAFGNENLGHSIGKVAGGLGRLLPFSAAEQAMMAQQQVPQYYAPTVAAPQQMAPYGFLGDTLSAIAPHAGRYIGRQFGYENAGALAGQVAGAAAQFIPYSAGEQVTAPTPYYPTQPVVAQPELAPYGLGGMLLGALAPAAGSAIGGLFGNKKLGRQIGTGVGIASSFLPFSTGPGQVAYLPVDYPTVH